MDELVTLPHPLEPDIEIKRQLGFNLSVKLPAATANCSPPLCLRNLSVLSGNIPLLAEEENMAWIDTSHDVLHFAFPVVIVWGVLSGFVSVVVIARQIRVSNDSYLLGYVLANILLLTCGGIIKLQDYIPHSNSYQYVYCYTKSLNDWFWYTSLWILVVMALERSMMATQSGSKSLCSPIQGCIVTVMIFCVCLVSALPQFWEYEVTETFDYGTNQTLAMAQLAPAADTPEFKVMYFWYTCTVTIFLPYPLMIAMIVMLSRGMKHSRQSRRRLSIKHGSGNILNRKVTEEIHLTRLYVVLILLYLLLTGPFCFLQLVDRVSPHWNWPVDHIYTTLYNIFEFAFYFYFAIGFFLYCTYYDKFRYSFTQTCCCCCSCCCNGCCARCGCQEQQEWQPVKRR